MAGHHQFHAVFYGHEIQEPFVSDGDSDMVAGEFLGLCDGYDAPTESGEAPLCALLASIREPEVLDDSVFGNIDRRLTPHLYTEQEITDLLVAAGRLQPRLRRATYGQRVLKKTLELRR